MSPADKEKLDMQARAQQMKINTRLTALQTAMNVMQTQGYLGVEGEAKDTKEPVWIHKPGSIDHLTLLAMATDIEKYILGEIEQETKEVLEALGKPRPIIVPVKDFPALNSR